MRYEPDAHRRELENAVKRREREEAEMVAALEDEGEF